ncbi:MAG: AMP-binding protein [Bacteroidales bacterium]|nr:AMP-binding protein [Bacteroidales bacterium]
MRFKETRHYLSFISDAIQTYWEKPALTDYQGSVSYSFAGLAEEIAKLHVLFRGMGVKAGDKIAICAKSCSNWAASFLAVESYKAVVVSVLAEFAGEDIINILNHSGSSLLIADKGVIKKLGSNVVPGIIATLDIDDFHPVAPCSEQISRAFSEWDEDFRKAWPGGVSKEDAVYPTDNLDELAMINYTSGTTSSPKGVQITFRNLSSNVTYGQNTVINTPENKMLSVLPLAHIFGLMFDLLYQLSGGVHIYYLTKTPTPSILMTAMKDVQPYMMLSVPLVIEKIVNKNIFPRIQTPLMRVLWNTPGIGHIIRRKVRDSLIEGFGGKLQFLIIGGAALNEDVEKCLKQIKFPYCCGYGMTEASPLVAYSFGKDYKFRSVGRIVERMEIKTVSGELLIRGENVTPGYYRNEEATAAAIDSEGWFHTGDLGEIDPEGNIYLHGRCKTMILGPSGQNIYPEEIESKLGCMEGVTDCLVIERQGKIVALVRLADSIGEERRKEWVNSAKTELNRHLPAYSQVAYFEIMENDFVKTPKNSIKRNLYR